MNTTKEELKNFAACLWQPGDIIEWRALQTGQAPKQGWTTAAELPDLAGMLGQLNRAGRNIYAGICPRPKAGDSESKDIRLARAVFVDFDKLEPADGETVEELAWFRILEAGLPRPTLMVQSGPIGCHAYWRLREPIEPRRFTECQKRLIVTLGTDKAIHDPARIMRLPAFLNQKPEYVQPYECCILRHDPERIYEPQDLTSHCTASVATGEVNRGGQMPIVETIEASPSTTVEDLERRGRAMLYASRWSGVPAGGDMVKEGRNSEAYKHTRELINDFALSPDDAWLVIQVWNGKNRPPLDPGELRAAFESAIKYGPRPEHPAGGKLTPPVKAPTAKAVTLASPAGAVGEMLENTITGVRRAVDWPIADIGPLTEALLDGTTTVLCGPKAVSKTFFVLSCYTSWVLQGIKAAFLVLEESSEHCLWRCLAQLAAMPGLSHPEWVRIHAAEARQAWSDYRETLDVLGSQLYDTPDDEMSLAEVAAWIRARGRDGCRIIIADPVTAAATSDRPWQDDKLFINEVKRDARRYGFSAILTTHPIKGAQAVPSLDSLSGGTAWARFAQTVLWLEAHEPKEVQAMLSGTRCAVEINRTMHVLAARNSFGFGKRIGLEFTTNLDFRSKGLVLRADKKESRK